MTYFDKEVYNKENLSKEDRASLDFWESLINNMLENALEDECDALEEDDALGKIKVSVIKRYTEKLRHGFEFTKQQYIICCIEGYESEDSGYSQIVKGGVTTC